MTSSTASLESAYVLDTHAPIWWLTQDRKLSADARQIAGLARRLKTPLVRRDAQITPDGDLRVLW